MIGAHVAGLPVEETMLGLLPLATALGAMLATTSQRVRAAARRLTGRRGFPEP